MTKQNNWPKRAKPPKCLCCQKSLRKHAHYNLHGDYGDGLFCGISCGYAWAIRNATADMRVGVAMRVATTRSVE